MLESGVSLVAVSLPSIWPLFSKRVLEQSLRSLRSALSMHSSPSTSRHSHTVTKGITDDGFSGSSRVNFAHSAESEGYESFAMQDKSTIDIEQGLRRNRQ